MSEMIYHITTKARWLSAKKSGYYTPEGYEHDGFIHCSEVNQVLITASKLYDNVPDLVLLQINCDQVNAKIIWENLEGKPETFPHIYGKLNLESVAGVQAFNKNQDGFFEFPDFMTSFMT